MEKGIELTEGKKKVIEGLLEEYDIQTAEDIQKALKDLLGGTIQNMLESEIKEHLGYDPHERSDGSNARNGKKSKLVCSQYGELKTAVPQGRESSFEPRVVEKRQKDISSTEGKIISMYAKRTS